MASKKLSLVIPVYGENEMLLDFVGSYIGMFIRNKINYEIILVLDCVPGRILKPLQDLAGKNPKITILCSDKRLGKGAAILDGFRASKGNFVGFSDADGSIAPLQYLKLIRTIERGYDGVIASRYIRGATVVIRRPWIRVFSSKIFNIFTKIVFGLPFYDTQCGAKIFTKDAVDAVIDEIKTKGFEMDVELLWRMKEKRLAIKEIPIDWGHKPTSTFSLLEGPSMFLNLLRVRFL